MSVRLPIDELHFFQAFKAEPFKWAWCLHCERAYELGQVRLVPEPRTDLRVMTGDMQMCPYDDCDGDAVIDVWPWSKVRELHPDYPDEPVPGVVYPLYG